MKKNNGAQMQLNELAPKIYLNICQQNFTGSDQR